MGVRNRSLIVHLAVTNRSRACQTRSKEFGQRLYRNVAALVSVPKAAHAIGRRTRGFYSQIMVREVVFPKFELMAQVVQPKR
jgi:hypothetical protein